jgi:hypothetical protein
MQTIRGSELPERDIREYVERYLQCQVLKVEQIKNPGFLQPFEVLDLKIFCDIGLKNLLI